MRSPDSAQVGPVGAESLDRALEKLRLKGAIFLRAQYTEAWAPDGQGGPSFAHVVAGSGAADLLPCRGERPVLSGSHR